MTEGIPTSVYRYINEVMNQRHIAALDDVCTEWVVQLDSEGSSAGRGVDELRAGLEKVFNDTPGLAITIEGWAVEGINVLVRSSVTVSPGDRGQITLSSFQMGGDGRIAVMRAPVAAFSPGSAPRSVSTMSLMAGGNTSQGQMSAFKKSSKDSPGGVLAGYGGGDPSLPGAINSGNLEYQSGAVIFSHYEGTARRLTPVITIYADELVGMSVFTPDQIDQTARKAGRAATGALIGAALGGDLGGAALGALIGGATTGSAPHGLALSMRRDGRVSTLMFAVRPKDINTIAGRIQRHRRDLGFTPLPEIHEAIETTRTETGIEVSVDSSPPQNMLPAGPSAIEQLKQLGELRDLGVLTQEEFDAKKSELLDRI